MENGHAFAVFVLKWPLFAADDPPSALSRFDKLKAQSKSRGLSNGRRRAGTDTRGYCTIRAIRGKKPQNHCA